MLGDARTYIEICCTVFQGTIHLALATANLSCAGSLLPPSLRIVYGGVLAEDKMCPSKFIDVLFTLNVRVELTFLLISLSNLLTKSNVCHFFLFPRPL